MYADGRMHGCVHRQGARLRPPLAPQAGAHPHLVYRPQDGGRCAGGVQPRSHAGVDCQG